MSQEVLWTCIMIEQVNTGLIKLIPKGSKRALGVGWKPITILNVCYKAFTKLLAN